MKKTFKLMLAFALVALGSTSAWAAGDLENTTQYADNGFKYKIISVYNTEGTGKENTVSVSQNVYANNGAAAMVIPATVNIAVKGTDSDGQDIDKTATFKIVEIEANGFKNLTKPTSIQIGANVATIGANAFDGCTNVTAITFDANTNAITIAGEAFKGTKVEELDLTPTKIATINTWFSNKYVLGTPTNATLTTVKFPTTLATINANAFAGCTALETVQFNSVAATPAQTFNAGAFSETAIETLDMTNTNLATLNKLFEDNNTSLKSITLPQTITTLSDNALANVILLNTVTFATDKFAGASTPAKVLGVQSSELATIGDGALSNTLVKSYDFSKCLKLTTFGSAKPFVNATTTKNKALQTVILPLTSGQTPDFSPVTAIGTAFANCQALTTITNLEASHITTVVDGAFANDVKLASLEFPTTIDAANGVKGTPFTGCTTLATLTFNTVAGTATAIGDATNSLFDATAQGALTTLAIIGDFAGTIKANAFSNCTNLTTVTISNGKEITGTITAGAIKLSETEASTVTLGKLSEDWGVAGIVGPVGTNAATVTIGNITVAQSAVAIVSNNIGTITLGEIAAGVALDVAALGQAETIVFGGEIKTGATVVYTATPNNRLTTINFGSIVIDDNADVIDSGAFDETSAPNLTSVSWNPAVAPTNAVFAQNAFGSASVGAGAKVTLHTTEAVAKLYGTPIPLEANLYNVIFDAVLTPADPDVASTVTVEGIDGGTYYWGIYYNASNTKKYYINDVNDDEEDVMVYSAFVDGTEQTIYFDPLARSNHRFIIAPEQAVMVRVKGTHNVNTFETAEDPTMRYNSTPAIVNDLMYATTVLSWDYLSTNYVGYDLYANLNIAKKGYIDFAKVSIDNPGYIAKGKLYVKTLPSAEANLRVKFLDDTDDAATVIERVLGGKQNGNGAIYNLQGVRVDSSYKGIVIKDGKKFLQK
ncbi:MAG: leucine-rich repeat protein [Bacteroidaceae bacterium]|nr:leucine-rich repeat protein [Bacteroidaceae bacterium]